MIPNGSALRTETRLTQVFNFASLDNLQTWNKPTGISLIMFTLIGGGGGGGKGSGGSNTSGGGGQ